MRLGVIEIEQLLCKLQATVVLHFCTLGGFLAWIVGE